MKADRLIKPLKKAALIVLVISAVVVLVLLFSRISSKGGSISAASDDINSTATPDESVLPEWTSTASATPTIRPTITILIPTETHTPSPTVVYYQPTSPSCDVAGFVADITIPDGTELLPGSSFTKTWSLRNDGSCTWNSAYEIYFYSGSIMDGPSSQLLTAENVYPGYSVEVSIDLVAPAEDGIYIGYWALRNAAGAHFGISPYGEPFYVEIVVSSDGPTATSTPGLTGTPTVTSTAGTATGTPVNTATQISPTGTPVYSPTAEPATNTPESTAMQIPPSETPIPTDSEIISS